MSVLELQIKITKMWPKLCHLLPFPHPKYQLRQVKTEVVKYKIDIFNYTMQLNKNKSSKEKSSVIQEVI